jgi:acyl-CoA thioesterase FadM
MNESNIQGRCHCGNISFTLQWAGEAQELAARSCRCSFCSQRAASWTSIPAARLEVSVRAPALVSRYSFASHSALFHVCSRCGAVPVSTSEIEGRTYAVINTMTLTSPVPGLVRSEFEVADEPLAARLARRKQTWIADVRFAHQAGAARPFTVQRTILFGDCDPGGVIYTPRVAYFVVEAAMAFLSDRLGTPAARNAMQSGVLPPARVLSIEYLQLMAYDERIEIEVHVDYVGQHSFSLALSARKPDQTLTFRARLVQVCIAAETKRPVALPAQLRAALTG